MGSLFYTAMALLNGVFTPFQSGCNARLAKATGHPILAAAVNTAVGTVMLLAIAAALRPGLPQGSSLAKAPWWAWVGGALGALYVSANLFLAPRVGAAALIGLVVAGQLVTSIALDHFGLVGYERHPVNGWRVVGALLLVAGAAMIRRS